ncbi:hypothetical protein [Phenylobacterium sp.]|nr:hypothetical protein [Phenylobacterium sp.]
MTTFDYAQVFENEYRPSRRIRRAVARVVWAGLFLVRPALAQRIWRERRG